MYWSLILKQQGQSTIFVLCSHFSAQFFPLESDMNGPLTQLLTYCTCSTKNNCCSSHKIEITLIPIVMKVSQLHSKKLLSNIKYHLINPSIFVSLNMKLAIFLQCNRITYCTLSATCKKNRQCINTEIKSHVSNLREKICCLFKTEWTLYRNLERSAPAGLVTQTSFYYIVLGQRFMSPLE